MSDREETCGSLPGLGDALGAGDTTGEHVDVITRVAKRLDGDARAEFWAHRDQLLRMASSESVDTFARRCRRLARDIQGRDADGGEAELDRQRRMSSVRRWNDSRSGMAHLHAELDPVRAATLFAALDAALARVRARNQQVGETDATFARLQVDALIEAVSDGEGLGAPEIAVLIDWNQLAADAAEAGCCTARSDGSTTVCETADGVPLPAETVRRFACDASVYPIVLGERGIVRDHGRNRRTASADQRRQLAAMHSTCGHPHCTVPLSATRAHHVRHWARHRGPTNVDNLLPLCETHHHLVHEGGWHLTMTPDREATWWLPDGTLYHRGSTIDRFSDFDAA